MADYDYEIIYKEGKWINEDALSRNETSEIERRPVLILDNVVIELIIPEQPIQNKVVVKSQWKNYTFLCWFY